MTDLVNHPSHYADGWSNGAEVIDITENLNFNRGNAVKYIARAGKKDAAKEVEDLEKAEFYLKREIERVKAREAAEKEKRALEAAEKDRRGRERIDLALFGTSIPGYRLSITGWRP